ncbi:hypothetical protein ACO0QE_002846 [Hanseniaspora vineae]
MNFSFLGGNSLSQLVIPDTQDESNQSILQGSQLTVSRETTSTSIVNADDSDKDSSVLHPVQATALRPGHHSTLRTGIPEVDKRLQYMHCGNGIYEIYGVPGIGKSTIAYNILKEQQKNGSCKKGNYLWVDTLKNCPFPVERRIKLGSITQLQMFFQRTAANTQYDMVIVDGFSKLLVQFLNNQVFKYEAFPAGSTSSAQTHQLKVSTLQTLFIQFLKYAERNNCKIILVNDCMNTSYKYTPDTNNSSDMHYQFVDENNPFLVVKRQPDSCMLLKSELEASLGMGSLDSKWLRFLKVRLGLYYTFNEAAATAKKKDEHSISCIFSTSKNTASGNFSVHNISFQLPPTYAFYSSLKARSEVNKDDNEQTQPRESSVSNANKDTLTQEAVSPLSVSSQVDGKCRDTIFESQI